MIIENDSHTVKELIEIGIPEECAAILCKLSYNTLVFEINDDKITAVSTFQICEEKLNFYGKTDIEPGEYIVGETHIGKFDNGFRLKFFADSLEESLDDKEYYIDFSSLDAVCKNRGFEIKHPERVGFSELAIASAYITEHADSPCGANEKEKNLLPVLHEIEALYYSNKEYDGEFHHLTKLFANDKKLVEMISNYAAKSGKSPDKILRRIKHNHQNKLTSLANAVNDSQAEYGESEFNIDFSDGKGRISDFAFVILLIIIAIAVCLVLEFAITAIIALVTGKNDLIGAYFTEFLPSRDFWLAIASGSIIIAVVYIIITIARKGKML